MIKYEGKFVDKNHFQKVHISRGGGGGGANLEKVHNFFFFFFAPFPNKCNLNFRQNNLSEIPLLAYARGKIWFQLSKN